MAALADTSIMIDHLRGRIEARELLREQRDRAEPVFASVLTKVEILAGMRAAEEPMTRRFFGTVLWVDVSDQIAERAGGHARRYLRSHPGVDLVDLVIVATAEELSVPLWTTNVKLFPMVAGLRAPY